MLIFLKKLFALVGLMDNKLFLCSEDYLVRMFEQVNLIIIHGKRVIRILLSTLTKFTTTESIGNWELGTL